MSVLEKRMAYLSYENQVLSFHLGVSSLTVNIFGK